MSRQTSDINNLRLKAISIHPVNKTRSTRRFKMLIQKTGNHRQWVTAESKVPRQVNSRYFTNFKHIFHKIFKF